MPKTLLLADDSVTIQKVVGITFANEDVELVTVDNGADALARAKDLKPDMIMADVAMPGLGGYELCAAIRRDPELCHIPVLLLTGTFETYDEQKALLVGASGHIAKPFEAQALISQFYALVDQDATRVVGPPPAAAARSAHPVAPPERVARQAAPVRATPAPAAQRPVARPAPAVQQPAARPAAAPATRPAAAAPPIQLRSAPAAPPAAARPAQAGPAPQPGATPQRGPTPPRPAAPQPLLRTDPSELPELPNTDFGPARAAAASLARAPGPAPVRSTLVADPNAVPVLPTEIADEEEFAFSDFEFNEATPASNSTDTGFFGEDSQPNLEADAYSETTFLDPRAARRASAAAPFASADPLADTIPEDPFGDPNDDTSAFARARADAFSRRQIEEAVPWPDPQPGAPAVSRRPVGGAPPGAPAAFDPVYDTLPELDSEPLEAELLEFEPAADTDSDADDFDAATVVAPHVFANAGRRSQPAPAPRPDAELFASEPDVELTQRAEPSETQGFRLDPTDMRSAIEKVAWEAFGALQEQLMRELVARAEAAIWEIVPQIAERLIREEIERIKSEA